MNKEDLELEIKCMIFFIWLVFLGDIIIVFNEYEIKGWEWNKREGWMWLDFIIYLVDLNFFFEIVFF